MVAPLMTKITVYLMIRVIFSIFTPSYAFLHDPGVQSLIVWVAALAIICASSLALAQRDLRRMLTLLIVAEVGYMVGGVWLANGQGLTGAILHIVNDSLMTLCLFLAAAVITSYSIHYTKLYEMFIIALVGLLMNLLAARFLHGHAHHDLNVRSAFLHVLGDALASVGVIIGGMIMYFTGWYVLDALVSVGIALIISWGSVRILREAGHILLEGVPAHIDLNKLIAEIRDIEGVNDVHQLHVWSICSHITALSAHIDLHPEYRLRQGEVIGRIEGMLEQDFHITRTTLQGECYNCANNDPLQPLEHRAPAAEDHQHHHAGHHHH